MINTIIRAREKYTSRFSEIGNVLALKLGGEFISDQFIIMLHKDHIFFYIYFKIHTINIKGKTNCNQPGFINARTIFSCFIKCGSIYKSFSHCCYGLKLGQILK